GASGSGGLGPARRPSPPGPPAPSRCGGFSRGGRRGPSSRLPPRRLPRAHALAELPPLAGRPLVEALAEERARRLLEAPPEGRGEERDELVRCQAAVGLEPADRLRLGEQRVAVAERVEDLAVDVAGGVAREVDDEGRDVVGVALRPGRELARPLAGLLEDLAPPRRRVDHARRAAREDRVRR